MDYQDGCRGECGQGDGAVGGFGFGDLRAGDGVVFGQRAGCTEQAGCYPLQPSR